MLFLAGRLSRRFLFAQLYRSTIDDVDEEASGALFKELWQAAHEAASGVPGQKIIDPLQSALLHQAMTEKHGKSRDVDPLDYSSYYDVKAECNTYSMPADHVSPDGRTVDVWAKRYRQDFVTPTKTLWMIQGGPGADSSFFDFIAAQMVFLLGGDDWEVATMDHRGTGLSTRLSCPGTAEDENGQDSVFWGEGETQECLDELNDDSSIKLSDYSVTNAAYDLKALIDDSTTSENHVYSVSYGTFLLNRFMELFPSGAASVVVDGVCQPMDADTPCGLDRFHFDLDLAVRRFLENQCASDADCKSALGNDPYAEALKVRKSIEGGFCKRLFDGDAESYGNMLSMTTSQYNAALNVVNLPILIGLSAKCDLEAAKAIYGMIKTLNEFLSRSLSRTRELLGLPERTPESLRTRDYYDDYLQSNSNALYNNIMVSEMWSGNYDYDDIDDEFDQLAGAAGRSTLESLWNTFNTWDKYSVGSRALATSAKNRLHIINGDTDSATPVDQAREYYAKTNVGGRTVTYHEFKSAGHGLVYGLTVNDVDFQLNCGTVLVAELVRTGNTNGAQCLEDILGDSLVLEVGGAGANVLENLWGIKTGRVLDAMDEDFEARPYDDYVYASGYGPEDSAASVVPTLAAVAAAVLALVL